MNAPPAAAVVQTAFIGDLVLTLPLVQALKRAWPETRIAVVTIPATAELLENHPDIAASIVFDKKSADAGPAGLLRAAARLREHAPAVVLVPHRSLRSAILARLSGATLRAGFSTSAGRFLFNRTVPYRREMHETDRNLSLLGAFGMPAPAGERPRLYPDREDARAVDALLGEHPGVPSVAVAPGSVWNTKRWPEEKFTALCRLLDGEGLRVVLVGGPADASLSARIAQRSGARRLVDTTGRFTLLQSAEAMRRCVAAVSNDSAPMHLAGAVGTPVIAIYGATVPAFGFAPRGERDAIVETSGLDCRPCGIHGGERCPIGTFVCMERVGAETVLAAVRHAVEGRGGA